MQLQIAAATWRIQVGWTCQNSAFWDTEKQMERYKLKDDLLPLCGENCGVQQSVEQNDGVLTVKTNYHHRKI